MHGGTAAAKRRRALAPMPPQSLVMRSAAKFDLIAISRLQAVSTGLEIAL